jgi:hypothetical protein
MLNITAVLTHASQQRISRSTEGAIPPAGVLPARIAFLPLQNPLQRIIDDPPVGVELGYEAF